MVIAPFFTSFLLRTISWKIILSDNGIVLGPLKDIGIIPADFRLLATPAAVIAGITYNFLPFMTLPLYVALEKIDRRLIEAAQDLYAGPVAPAGHHRRRHRRRSPRGDRRHRHGVRRDHARRSPGRIGGMIIGTFLISEAFIRIVLPLVAAGHLRGVPARVHPGDG